MCGFFPDEIKTDFGIITLSAICCPAMPVYALLIEKMRSYVNPESRKTSLRRTDPFVVHRRCRGE